MASMSILPRAVLCLGFALLPVRAQAPETVPVEALDEGRLQTAWFGPEAVFRKGKDVDFLWIKPGLDLSGRTICMRRWEPPVMIVPGRNEKDLQKATELTYFFPIQLRSELAKALAGVATFSSTTGDLALTGRFVDANAGSDVTRLLLPVGPGTASATWDLKLVDIQTGELLLAVHHRCLSGTAFTGIQDKLEKWSRAFAQNLRKGSF